MLELLDAPLGFVAIGQLLQVVANKPVEALAETVGSSLGANEKLLVD